ncbi:MAG: hypothetical protein LBQ94_07750 [Treponema sp.]|nr:hypothetical protein [Treponema sp.]
MKMGNIYALQGKGNTGKTATIKLVYENLKTKSPSAQIQNMFPLRRGKEITIILTGINGETIGIESSGDYEEIVEKSLIIFEKAGCTIIFCACRTKGGTVDCIKRHTRYTPHFIRQETDPRYNKSQQDQNNDLMAKILIKTAGL